MCPKVSPSLTSYSNPPLLILADPLKTKQNIFSMGLNTQSSCLYLINLGNKGHTPNAK